METSLFVHIKPRTVQQNSAILEEGTEKKHNTREEVRRKEGKRQEKASCPDLHAIDKMTTTTTMSLRGNNNNVSAMRREGEDGGRERVIAVAIDKDKISRYALKWAVDNVISFRYQTLKLVHVRCRPSSSPPFQAWLEETPPDAQTMELFLPFRCYCLRRHVQSEVVVLEDSDVAKALVGYVSRNAVDTLILGSSSRKSFSRLFKFADTPNTILKYAPDYCNIYVVGKEKAVSIRSATRPVPNLLTIEETAQVNTHNYSSRTYDELSTCENDFSCANSERLSMDSSFISFYEDLGLGRSNSSASIHFEDTETSGQSSTSNSASAHESATQNGEKSMLGSSCFSKAVEEELLRTKLELKRTTDLYHAACKEAIREKQKVTDCHKYQIELEKKLQEARSSEQAALAVMEKEREKWKTAAKVHRLADKETWKRLDGEKKAHKDDEYQSLVHIMVVLLFFFAYHICLR